MYLIGWGVCIICYVRNIILVIIRVDKKRVMEYY